MALILNFLPHRQSLQPGNELTASLEVGCRAVKTGMPNTGILLAAVWVEATGSERVDTSWVAAGYAANVQPAHREGRRLIRHLFNVSSAPVLQEALLTPGCVHRFVFSMRLPELLPPTFRGTALRYSYTLQAHARFTAITMALHSRQPSRSSAGPSVAVSQPQQENCQSPAGHRKSERQPQLQTARMHLHIWPKTDMERRQSAVGSIEPQAAEGLHYNVPAAELDVQLKAATDPQPAEEAAAAAGASFMMHAASRPALLDAELRRASGNSPVAAASRGSPVDVAAAAAERLAIHGSHGRQAELRTSGEAESASHRSFRRQSMPETPAHAAGEPASQRTYNLRMGESPLVRVALQQGAEAPLTPGAPLAGTLDFRAGRDAANGAGGPRCTEVLVLLETEEALTPAAQPSSRPGAGVIRKVWDEWSELTPDTVLTHFLFSIPLDAPPSFATPALRLQWLLRFQFTAAPPQQAASGWQLGLGSSQPSPEQISWVLPLTVRPPSVMVAA